MNVMGVKSILNTNIHHGTALPHVIKQAAAPQNEGGNGTNGAGDGGKIRKSTFQ